jgi:hypothetical protein
MNPLETFRFLGSTSDKFSVDGCLHVSVPEHEIKKKDNVRISVFTSRIGLLLEWKHLTAYIGKPIQRNFHLHFI